MAASPRSPLSMLRPGAIKEHYDDFAWVYQTYWGEHIHHGLFLTGEESAQAAQENLLRHCAALAEVAGGSTVADVGCGHGGTARFLAREYGCHVEGLTISETQWMMALESAKSFCGPGSLKFDLADAEHFQFPPSHFDLVWNMESSEHFFDKARYFRKVAETLKAGGRLLLAAWTGSMRKHVVREIAATFLCPGLLTAKEYAELIQRAGLTVTAHDEAGPRVAKTWDLCAEHARSAKAVLRMLPKRYRDFAEGIALMREGYRSGDLNYSIFAARK